MSAPDAVTVRFEYDTAPSRGVTCWATDAGRTVTGRGYSAEAAERAALAALQALDWLDAAT